MKVLFKKFVSKGLKPTKEKNNAKNSKTILVNNPSNTCYCIGHMDSLHTSSNIFLFILFFGLSVGECN